MFGFKKKTPKTTSSDKKQKKIGIEIRSMKRDLKKESSQKLNLDIDINLPEKPSPQQKEAALKGKGEISKHTPASINKEQHSSSPFLQDDSLVESSPALSSSFSPEDSQKKDKTTQKTEQPKNISHSTNVLAGSSDKKTFQKSPEMSAPPPPPTQLEKLLAEEQALTTPPSNTSVSGKHSSKNKEHRVISEFMAKKKASVEQSHKAFPWLALSAIMSFLVAVSAGTYYYFNVIQSPTPKAVETPTVPETPLNEKNNPVESSIPSSDQPTAPEKNPEESITLPPSLKNAAPLTVSAEKPLKVAWQEAIQSFSDSSEERFFIPQRENHLLSVAEINAELGIDLIEIEKHFQSAYLFATANKQSKAKTGIVYLVSTAPEEVLSSLSSAENILPQKLAGLYNSLPQYDIEKVLFKKSDINPTIRFFNFSTGDPTLSLDWGIITKDKTSFLIFSTAKSITEQLISHLTTE